MSDLFSIASKWSFSSLFSIVLPGLVLVLLLLPLVDPFAPQMLKIDEVADLATILLAETLILGLFVSLLRNVVYRIYEGRLLWPQWLHKKLTRRINNRVVERLKETEELDTSSAQYKESWYWLRMFPLDEKGDPIARRPTILGNVLEGYEEYPLRRYGMDSIFYWYRLSPNLPENFVQQMDQLWAEADCLMYISFSGLGIGLVYTILAIVKWIILAVSAYWTMFPTAIPSYLDRIPSWGTPMGWAVGCIIIGYIVYRVSLPLHRRNGEYFKAAFDLYRDRIADMTKVSPEEKTKWRRTWTYLQYMYTQCQHCKRHYYAEAEQCPHCGKKSESQDEADNPKEKQKT